MTAADILYGRRGGGWADGPAKHLCHARGCQVSVPPRMLMCKPHWSRVPAELQRAVWREYTPGQEMSKDPTPAYLEAARAAIESVPPVKPKPAPPPSLFDDTGNILVGIAIGLTAELVAVLAVIDVCRAIS